MEKLNGNDLEFVVESYKQGRLNTDEAWTKLSVLTGINRQGKHWKKYAVAASVSLLFGVAMACLVIPKEKAGISSNEKSTPKKEKYTNAVTNCRSVKAKVFFFDNTPVNKALKEISQYYGCELTCNDSTKFVSGEIETKSVSDAINVLEATFNIKITRK